MVVLAAVVVGVSACGDGEDRPGQVSSESVSNESGSNTATATVDVTLRDYAFVGLPPSVQGPNVLFAAKIRGSNTHEFEVVGPDAMRVGRIPAFEGTETKSLAVVLVPGSYSVRCLVKEGSKTHAELGMRARFTVET